MRNVRLGVLSGEIPRAKREPKDLPFTAEQLQVAQLIDDRVLALVRSGVEADLVLLKEMDDYMAGFKRIMDTATPPMIKELCSRYPGFHLFTRTLEGLARDIRSGVIQVPR